MALKIIFMGTPEFSVPVLRSLNLKHEIILDEDIRAKAQKPLNRMLDIV